MVTTPRVSAERFTTADLDLLPDIPGWRYEIIDGELFVTKAPTTPHQVVSLHMATDLDNWNRTADLGYVIPTPGVIFADDDNAIPDIVWVSKERLKSIHGADQHLHAAPDLVIEVLSPGTANQRRDLQAKLNLYGRRQVPEYWVLDWQQEQVMVYRREGTDLVLSATLGRDDTLTSPQLPGFSCPVGLLFAGLPL